MFQSKTAVNVMKCHLLRIRRRGLHYSSLFALTLSRNGLMLLVSVLNNKSYNVIFIEAKPFSLQPFLAVKMYFFPAQSRSIYFPPVSSFNCGDLVPFTTGPTPPPRWVHWADILACLPMCQNRFLTNAGTRYGIYCQGVYSHRSC